MNRAVCCVFGRRGDDGALVSFVRGNVFNERQDVLVSNNFLTRMYFLCVIWFAEYN